MGYDVLTVGEWIILVAAFAWAVIAGVLAFFRTNEVLRWVARLQVRMWGIVGSTVEDLPPRRQEYVRKALESPEETGGPNKCMIRFAGCGHLVFAILMILFIAAHLLSK